MAYRLTATAEAQIDTILLESARRHGIETAGRYGQLILAVLKAVGNDPQLPGALEISRLPGCRAYPLRLGRRRIEPARRIGTPRHLVVYRVQASGIVEILGLAHDRMVLSRAARRMARATDDAR